MSFLNKDYIQPPGADDTYETTFGFVTEKTFLIVLAMLISYAVSKFSYLL